MLPLGVKVGERMFRFFWFILFILEDGEERQLELHGISIIRDDPESVSIIIYMTCSLIQKTEPESGQLAGR